MNNKGPKMEPCGTPEEKDKDEAIKTIQTEILL